MELKRLTEAPYTVKVKLKDPDGQEEEIKVLYKPITPAMMKEIDVIREDPERSVVDQLLLLVRELPDLQDQGQPVTVSRELFDSMDGRHLKNMVQAIINDFFGIEPTETIPTEEGIAADKRHEESLARERAEREAAQQQQIAGA